MKNAEHYNISKERLWFIIEYIIRLKACIEDIKAPDASEISANLFQPCNSIYERWKSALCNCNFICLSYVLFHFYLRYNSDIISKCCFRWYASKFSRLGFIFDKVHCIAKEYNGNSREHGEGNTEERERERKRPEK